RLWRARLPLATKLEGSFHLLGNVGFLLLLVLMLVTLPLQVLRLLGYSDTPELVRWVEGAPLAASLACVLLHYGVAQQTLGRFDLHSALRLPLVLALGAGMTVNATAAFFAGLGRRTGEFRRTPKAGGAAPYQLGRNSRGAFLWLELLLAGWGATGAVLSWALARHWTAVFHGLFAAGLFWVGASSLRDELHGPTPEPVDAAPQVEPSA